MTVAEILKQRLQNQLLVASTAQSPGQVVKRLLAVQAQDYLGSLWALGQRLPVSTEKTIEDALSNGTIIRTWPMRGTLHFVHAEDARWLVGFLAHRVLTKARSTYKNAGLDDAVFKKCTQLVTKALQKESRLTRDELYQLLERARISTADARGLHITGYLALKGLICFGPRKGKQQTFVLMDEWLRSTKTITPVEVLPTLALRYFEGHGPATVQDFAWWSGLTLTESREAITQSGTNLFSEKVNDEYYYTVDQQANEARLPEQQPVGKINDAHLLPGFDEFTVAYKDRSPVLSRDQQHRGSMEVLSSVVVINGVVVGTWSRTLTKNGVQVRVKPFSKLSATQLSKIKHRAIEYAHFVGSNDAFVQLV
ncbi:MAG TPA: winged helix DNA-binding domain-containing protein [Chryseolinea sp.]|nr:winged helix DNA-binding domain-containing protein [Chryseolinea sp.]